MTGGDRKLKEAALLLAIKRDLPALLELLDEVSGHWEYEDGLYRFYHQSFKVYALQSTTLRVVDALRALLPDATLDKWFSQIVAEGTGKTFDYEHNQRLLAETRPIVDVTVICGKSERDPDSSTHVTNPKVVIEVLSPGTEEYDRSEKLQHYQQVPSLEAILLVDHRNPRVELWSRQGEGWGKAEYGAGQTVAINAVDCELSVDAIYAAARDA